MCNRQMLTIYLNVLTSRPPYQTFMLQPPLGMRQELMTLHNFRTKPPLNCLTGSQHLQLVEKSSEFYLWHKCCYYNEKFIFVI